MANLDSHDGETMLGALRRRTRPSGPVQQAQMMVLAAGLAAFGIVAVAAAMMTTLL